MNSTDNASKKEGPLDVATIMMFSLAEIKKRKTLVVHASCELEVLGCIPWNFHVPDIYLQAK
jgi:hypothetical protein